jgi:protein-S-isoprenylcysteine O-methyltransferase Ste14
MLYNLSGKPDRSISSMCIVYITSAFLLLVGAFFVFRVLARRDYHWKGRLTPFSAFLELLIWALYFGFPYIYNPPDWPWFWSLDTQSSVLWVFGFVCITVGFVLAFVTMFWFGLRRAFGLQVNELIQAGPYRLTRNPQIVGGSLLVIGSVMQWPSWYALGWVILYGAIAHMMVLTEEGHLRNAHGEGYMRYCERVPRYLGLPRRS